MKSRKHILPIAIALVFAFIGAAMWLAPNKHLGPSEPIVSPEQTIKETANQVVTAIKQKDTASLAKLTHPDVGLRLSPYTYVSNKDIVLKASDLATTYSGQTKFIWGYTDGKGDPINLTFKEYFDQYVYSDFSEYQQISYDTIIRKGNTINNTREFYPDSIIVEYHYPGSEQFSVPRMDWKSLRLVFQKKDATWYLVGIVKDQWTI